LGGENLQPSDDMQNVNIDEEEDSLLTIFDPRTRENLEKAFEKVFSFLFNSENLKSLDGTDL
jgi:hypothetical protein